MSDRETRMMARMRRQDEARRERRDRITTYGLGVVIITFIGARYTNHGKLERACLALLAAFGAYAVGVRCGVFYPRISRRRRGGRDRVGGVDAARSTPSPRRESTTHRSRWPP
jgi:hypothetical protein